MGGPLVVQRPGLGRGAHLERAGRDQHLGGQGERVGRCGRWRVGDQHRLAGAQLVGGQHRLVVLLLVLHDHREREPVLDQPPPLQRDPFEQAYHPLTDLAHVPAGRPGLQQRQPRPGRARMLEGVVEPVHVVAEHRVASADVAQQPQLLLVADVGQVPHQGGHQR